MSLLVGALLNSTVLTLVCAAMVLAWLAALWRKEIPPSMGGHPWRTTVADAWGQFGIPWMLGCAATGASSWLGIVLGICLTFSYIGSSRQPTWRPAIVAGQLAALAIMLGIRQVFAIAVISVLLTAQTGLLLAGRSNQIPNAQWLAGLHLLLLGVMLIASFAISLGK